MDQGEMEGIVSRNGNGGTRLRDGVSLKGMKNRNSDMAGRGRAGREGWTIRESDETKHGTSTGHWPAQRQAPSLWRNMTTRESACGGMAIIAPPQAGRTKKE